MSRDLEETLNEMGPEYRAVVARLRSAREVQNVPVFRPRAKVLRPALAAASLAAAVVLGVFVLKTDDAKRETADASFAPREYRASVDEMIATQRPDGGWQNDFLTRRNAAALRLESSPAARLAYRKAMRNLRLRGSL